MSFVRRTRPTPTIIPHRAKVPDHTTSLWWGRLGRNHEPRRATDDRARSLRASATASRTITLNRPDAMNGLDLATKEALLDAVRQAEQDAAVRCVVLTGSGRAFCVGQDLKEHIAILQSSDAESLFRTVEEHYNPIVTALATMPKPVVAAVNGVAAGAGASLAFACDFRILTEAAGLQPRVRRRRPVLRHRLVVDPPPAGRPGQGDRAALLPAHDRLRGVPRAGARHQGRRPPTSSRRRSRRSPAGWLTGRRCPTGRSGARWSSPPATAWPSRWSSRGR